MSTEWTVEKVIEEAAKLPGWFLDRNYIRRVGDQCPISCLDNKPDFLVVDVCKKLGYYNGIYATHSATAVFIA